MKKFDNSKAKTFFEAVLSLESIEECEVFFEDIFTIKELQDVSQRIEVAKMLDGGSNYNVISEKTGASTATISRVNRCLIYGNGGYKTALGKMANKNGGTENEK